MNEKKKQTLIITKIVRQNKTNKDGKAYKTIGILTQEVKNQNGEPIWINGWGNKITDYWNEGDKVEVLLYKQEYNGTVSLRFDVVTQAVKTNEIEEQVKELDKRITILENLFSNNSAPINGLPRALNECPPHVNNEIQNETPKTEVTGNEEIKIEEIPF